MDQFITAQNRGGKMLEDKIKILLIDDDEIDREAIIRYINKNLLPYFIDEAGSEEEAVDALSKNDYDVILLDYDLGTATAIDILPKTKNIPVIFVTGAGSEEIAVEVMREGASDYIVKDSERNYLSVLPITIKNVLEKRRIVKAFTESEARFRAIIETASDMIIISDGKGNYKYASPSTSMTGYTPEEITSKKRNDLVHPDDILPLEEATELALQNPGEEIKSPDIRIKNKNGEWVLLEGKLINLLELPGVNGIVYNGRDITQRKKNEEEREKLIKELRQALEEIKTLQGIVPICSKCKKIRNDTGFWEQVDVYVEKHSGAQFSHGLCPDCIHVMYPDLADKILKDCKKKKEKKQD